MTSAWETVVRETLAECQKRGPEPIPGARFRTVFDRFARMHDLAFPPADNPNLKFSRFLEKFPTIITIARQPGTDFLIAPAANPEQLVQAQRAVVEIRRDLFDAFTFVTTGRRPWYSKQRDKVVWLGSEEEPQEELVSIPSSTLDNQIQVRKSFVERLNNKDSAEQLTAALSSSRPLAAFTAAIRMTHQQAAWHAYRAGHLVETIRDWANMNGIPWREDWLVAHSRAASAWHVRSEGTVTTDTSRTALLRISRSLGQLSESDLARIHVPLDIVLRLVDDK